MRVKNKMMIVYSLLVIFGTILVVPFIKSSVIDSLKDTQYVSGKFGSYCYRRGTENKNIRYKMYYHDLESCGKPLKS